MGPKSQQAIADGQDAIIAALGHIATEQRQTRALLRRIAAKLEIEIEDRETSDEKQGEWLAKHEGKIARIEQKLAAE